MQSASSVLAMNEQSFLFQHGVKPDVGLINFWPPEDGFVWSAGAWCEVTFPMTLKPRTTSPAAEIELEVDVFKAPPELEGQNALIYVNGLRLASRFISSRVTILLEVAAGVLRAGENIITIDTPDATQPTEFGKTDGRRLGLQLFSIHVREA